MNLLRRLLPDEHPPIILLPLLLVAALAGNYFPFQLMLNFQVVFGSIFAFVALQLYGLAAGCLVGFAASCLTFFLWNQPYSVVVMSLEILAVGWAHRRRGLDLLVADTIYWIVLGAPLNWALNGLIVARPPDILWMIMAKQAVNGIVNALVARLIVTALAFSNLVPLPRALARTRLHDLIFTTLAAFLLFPALVLVGVNGRSEEAKAREDARGRLQAVSRQTHAVVDGWLEDHLRVIGMIALEVRPSAVNGDIQKRLDSLRAVDDDFLRAAVMNRDSVAVAYSPRLDAFGRPTVGQNVAGSVFVESLRRTLRPGLSDVIIAKIGAPVPIVVAGVPLVEDGRFAGYIGAVINVETLSGVIGGLLGNSGLHATLLDGQGRVIASNRGDARVMGALPWRSRGEVRETGGGLRQWFPAADEGVSLVERLRRSFHFVEVPMHAAGSWRLVVESPVEPYQKRLNAQYAATLGMLFAVFVSALVAAWVVSRKAAASIRVLGEISAGLPERISRNEPIAWPATAVAETESLVENFRATAGTLSRSFEELRIVNDTLERRVADRTMSVRFANEELRREIAERREIQAQLSASEASYRLLAENSTDVIARIATDGATLYASPAVVTLLGYQPKEVVGADIFAMAHPDDLPKARSAWADVLQGGEPVLVANRVRRKDGAWIWVETAARAVVDPETGAPREIVLVIRDVSDRKRAEEENAQLVERMLHAQKLESLGLLAGGIAHDFNNLLTSVLGNADLAHLNLPPDSPVHERLRQIETAARRAAEMAGQMLAYSGQGRFVLRQADLSAIVREMASLLRSSIPKTCVLDLRLAERLPAIEADASQIQQVVMNLITNAAEAIGDRPGTITLRTEPVKAGRGLLDGFHMSDGLPEGLYVRLEVIDTGCGMVEETRSRMFDPFFTTKFTGRGLGLAAVLGIVRSHRGTLKVVSAPGEGTSFAVLLPAAGPAALAAVPEQGAAGDRLPPLPGAVLVADDEEGVREVASSMLRQLGLDVITARDGLEAVETFRARPDSIQLVLLDVTMPRMGGEAALEQMRRIRGDVPVILSSGYALQAQEGRLAELGAARFIQKPYTLTELARVVREAVKERVR